jgi:KipI family sensor histidine kinase inhibitor
VSDGVRFLPSSDQTLMVYFGESITLEAHERVVKFLRLLEREPVAAVRNLHPGYCSVLVKFDALACSHAELEAILRGYLVRLETVKVEAARLVEIPVCYGGEFGPDMVDVCELHGLTREEIVERHCSVEYLVYFLGFVPGFAYLGRAGGLGMEEGAGPISRRGTGKTALLQGKAGLRDSRPFVPKGKRGVQGVPFTSRLGTPRKKVPAGSVGIAGEQTGVYPFATPGGWRLIGRTPMKMFRSAEARSALAIGDRVRFVAISAERFAELEAGAA